MSLEESEWFRSPSGWTPPPLIPQEGNFVEEEEEEGEWQNQEEFQQLDQMLENLQIDGMENGHINLEQQQQFDGQNNDVWGNGNVGIPNGYHKKEELWNYMDYYFPPSSTSSEDEEEEEN